MGSETSSLVFAIAAQAVLVVHFAWIVFVVLGAFFLRRHPRLRLLHLTAVLYSVGIELYGWVCPLTHLETSLWQRAGLQAYEGAFIQHYLERIVYLRAPQEALIVGALTVLILTLALYFWPATDTRSRRSVERK